MNSKSSPHHELHDEVEQKKSKERFLILHNDDYHTFDYVINALMEICEHDFLQAEQCTQLVHFKGKCDVKKGTYAYLKPMKNALLHKELKATIE